MAVKAQRINELRVSLTVPSDGVMLHELEEFCESLRKAGAIGGLKIKAISTDLAGITFTGVQLNPEDAS